jgi:hypothetical protein
VHVTPGHTRAEEEGAERSGSSTKAVILTITLRRRHQLKHKARRAIQPSPASSALQFCGAAAQTLWRQLGGGAFELCGVGLGV